MALNPSIAAIYSAWVRAPEGMASSFSRASIACCQGDNSTWCVEVLVFADRFCTVTQQHRTVTQLPHSNNFGILRPISSSLREQAAGCVGNQARYFPRYPHKGHILRMNRSKKAPVLLRAWLQPCHKISSLQRALAP